MGRFKISVHPLYFCLFLFYVVIGKSWMFFAYFISVLFHEIAHARVAYARGYKMQHIKLMPYGAMLYGGEDWAKKDSLYIALAGPIANGLFALLLVAFWWIIPDLYTITKPIFNANIALMLFNLLPCFPLDGGRAVLSFFKKRITALKVVRAIGVIISLIVFSLGVASLFYQFNVTWVVGGIFLFYGAISGSKKEMYLHIANSSPYIKDYNKGVICKKVMISQGCRAYKLLEHIKPNTLVTFTIVDNNKNIIYEFSENNLLEFLTECNAHTLISEIIEKKKISFDKKSKLS